MPISPRRSKLTIVHEAPVTDPKVALIQQVKWLMRQPGMTRREMVALTLILGPQSASSARLVINGVLGVDSALAACTCSTYLAGLLSNKKLKGVSCAYESVHLYYELAEPVCSDIQKLMSAVCMTAKRISDIKQLLSGKETSTPLLKNEQSAVAVSTAQERGAVQKKEAERRESDARKAFVERTNPTPQVDMEIPDSEERVVTKSIDALMEYCLERGLSFSLNIGGRS